jgi:hypothetical protein
MTLRKKGSSSKKSSKKSSRRKLRYGSSGAIKQIKGGGKFSGDLTSKNPVNRRQTEEERRAAVDAAEEADVELQRLVLSASAREERNYFGERESQSHNRNYQQQQHQPQQQGYQYSNSRDTEHHQDPKSHTAKHNQDSRFHTPEPRLGQKHSPAREGSHYFGERESQSHNRHHQPQQHQPQQQGNQPQHQQHRRNKPTPEEPQHQSWGTYEQEPQHSQGSRSRVAGHGQSDFDSPLSLAKGDSDTRGASGSAFSNAMSEVRVGKSPKAGAHTNNSGRSYLSRIKPAVPVTKNLNGRRPSPPPDPESGPTAQLQAYLEKQLEKQEVADQKMKAQEKGSSVSQRTNSASHKTKTMPQQSDLTVAKPNPLVVAKKPTIPTIATNTQQSDSAAAKPNPLVVAKKQVSRVTTASSNSNGVPTPQVATKKPTPSASATKPSASASASATTTKPKPKSRPPVAAKKKVSGVTITSSNNNGVSTPQKATTAKMQKTGAELERHVAEMQQSMAEIQQSMDEVNRKSKGAPSATKPLTTTTTTTTKPKSTTTGSSAPPPPPPPPPPGALGALGASANKGDVAGMQSSITRFAQSAKSLGANSSSNSSNNSKSGKGKGKGKGNGSGLLQQIQDGIKLKNTLKRSQQKGATQPLTQSTGNTMFNQLQKKLASRRDVVNPKGNANANGNAWPKNNNNNNNNNNANAWKNNNNNNKDGGGLIQYGSSPKNLSYIQAKRSKYKSKKPKGKLSNRRRITGKVQKQKQCSSSKRLCRTLRNKSKNTKKQQSKK